MRPLIGALYDITEGDEVAVRVIDGRLIRGVPSRIERDEAGIRIELCPFRGNEPQYRLRASRSPSGWRTPIVERLPMDGDWERYGRLVGIE